MRILDLALNDLKQVLRDRKSLVFLVVMPIAFTALMGYVFSGNTAGDPRLALGWRDLDEGTLSAHLRELLAASPALRLVDLAAEADPAAEVKAGRLAAAVVVPQEFSTATLAGEAARLTLVADPAASTGQAAYQAVRTAFVRVLSAAWAGQAALTRVEAAAPFASAAERQAALEQAVASARAAWQAPPLAIAREAARGAAGAPAAPVPSGFAQSSPGMIVMFSIFGLTTSSTLLVAERNTRTLQRMLTTPMSRAEVIAGHALALVALVVGQQALLVITGQALFGVDYAREPLALLLVMSSLALWVAGLGLLLGVVARGEDQVIIVSLVAMFAFSALGGAWFPLEVTGPAFSAVGHLMPSAWAMDGFQNLVVRGLGLPSVLAPAAIMAVYAALFLGLAIWRFGRE